MDRARILVVEDEELSALAIKKCLEGLGYEVPDVVASGEEAVEKSAALEADLVLMDIHLRGAMSGIDAAGLIRSSRVPVVYLTAYSDQDTLDKAKLTEPFGFIIKPFEEKSLEATVKMALSRSRGQKELRGSHDRMSAILFSTRDAIIVIQPNGTMEYVNERARSLFELPASLPPFSSVLPLLKPVRTGAREALSTYLDQVILEGRSVGLENCEIARSDGSALRVQVNLEPYRAPGGNSRGVMLVFRDRENVASSVIQPSLIQSSEQVPPSGRRSEARSADGGIDIRISADRMAAVADFSPSAGTGAQIELASVGEKLAAMAVRFGIDWDAINSSILACTTSRKRVANVEIARGRKPAEEVDSRLEIEPSLLRKRVSDEPQTRTVDFKALSPFEVVKKGGTLALMVPRTEGEAGIDVTGVAVAYGRSTRKSLRPGKNTLTEGDRVVAACDGKFVTGEDSFWVSEVLEIPGDVDYSTGHIDFPGDVIVHGQIKQGFMVKAGGSLTCAKTIDASEISCGGDLVTDQGILGRIQSTVKVGGQIHAKFIENCYVEAGGDVHASTGCLNSVVNTLGASTTGPKGVIIGGKLWAQKGVTAFQIGSPAGVRTEICCSEDYRAQQKLAWIRDRNTELVLKLKEVEARLASTEKGNPRLVQTRDKLRIAIEKMNDSAKSLNASLQRNKEAAVTARGDLHQGVLVEICHVPFQVAKPLSGVRLVLDATSLFISTQRLGKA